MKIDLKYIILSISIILFILDLHAQSFDGMFSVRHIGRNDGLSSERVFSIVEDDDHVMWISTRTGVDRYNGRTVKNYSLPGNYYYGDMAGKIIRLYIDGSFGLLAYDNTGRIYKYQSDTDSFELFLFLGDYINGEIILNKVLSDENGTFWFGLGNGLYCKKSDGSFGCVIDDKYVNDIACMGDSLYIGTSNGIFQLSCMNNLDINQLVEDKDVLTLYCDNSDKKLWFGTFNSGLGVMNLVDLSYHRVGDRYMSFLKPIRSITRYVGDKILVGIDGGGVYFVDKQTEEVRLFVNTEDSGELFLLGNGIYAITTVH